MQAQPMLLHTSSNQLVETAILSTDFSQSAILQSALHPRSQPARSRDRSPSRERNRSPSRSRDCRRQYRQRSPSPDYCRRSPPRRPRSPSQSYHDPPPRERYQGSYRRSPPRTSNREPRAEGSSNFNQRRGIQYHDPSRESAYAPPQTDDTFGQGWGASSPVYPGPSAEDDRAPGPLTSRRN